jgi:hypothetical protein
MSDVTYAIFPAIGVARLGNAPTEFYIGPEKSGGLPVLPNNERAPFRPEDFRDAEGRLRRQAARFRIFRTEDGAGGEEITLDHSDVADIRWTVHLANKKASWYQFQTSKGQDGYAPNHPLRNGDRKSPDERRKLFIDPGPREIAGPGQGVRERVEFSRTTIPGGYKGGNFPPDGLKPYGIDTLGALQTDSVGRLLVLGGLGRSGSTNDPPELPTYANNDGWWDDVADGPVRAVVVLKSGESIEVTAAWVLVAPPKYAPQIPNLVTLYDTIFDVAVRRQGYCTDIYENGFWKGGANGYRPHFERDIKPIFERASNYVWVTAIPPKPHSFNYELLGDPRQSLNGLRKFFLDVIRAPGQENRIASESSGATMMPYIAGDDCLGAADSSGASQATAKYLRLTDTQYFFLQQWSEGYFKVGATPEEHPGHRLTRGVLENCVGGGFSPGIEMTWISREPRIYSEPFRIKARADIPDPLSLGFDPALGMEPGDVSRYMALPWQADFNECSSQPVEGRMLWWWPAQRPEFVHLLPSSIESTEEGGTTNKFGRQVPWVGTDYDQTGRDYISFATDVEMVENWDRLGFVYNIGSAEQPHFVEVMRTLPRG